MASKNQFLKLFKEDMKRRTLSIVLSCIVEFLLFPVGTLFFFQTEIGDVQRDLRQILYFIEEPIRMASVLIAVCGAIICAYSGFSYLFHKTEVDFYHSLPFNRRKQFAVRYINGYLVYFVPFLVFLLISLPIYMVNMAGFSPSFVSVFLYNILYANLIFLIVYNLVILGSMLTGNISNAGVMSLFLGLYTTVTAFLIDGYMATFLDTYRNNDLKLIETAKRFSPLFYIQKILEGGYELPSVILIVFMLLLSYFLYVNRKMEKAGMGGIYPKVVIVVRFCITVFTGLGLGMVFASGNHSSAWLLFGVIFGSVVAHVLINALFNMTIKDALKGKRFLAIAGLSGILIALAIRYDCFGYDRYLPSKSSVKSVSLEIGGLGNRKLPRTGNVYRMEHSHEVQDLLDAYPRRIQSSVAEVELTAENDLAYQIAVMSRDRQKGKWDFEAAVSLERGTYEEVSKSVFEDKTYEDEYFGRNDLYLTFKLHLKNGGTVIRHYNIYNDKEFTDTLVKLYHSEEFKAAVLKANAGGKPQNLVAAILEKNRERDLSYWSYPGSYTVEFGYSEVMYENKEKVIFNKDTVLKLYHAYQEDLKNLSINEEVYGDWIGGVRFVYEGKKGLEVFETDLSSAYLKTIEVLKEIGYDKYLPFFMDEREDEIKELVVFDRWDDDVKTEGIDRDFKGFQVVARYKEKEEIHKVYNSLLDSYRKTDELGLESRYVVRIILKNEDMTEKAILSGTELEKRMLELDQ